MTRRALVTGLGFITPIGNDRAKVTEHLRQGIHGFEMVEFLSNPRLTVRVAGTIKDFVANTPHWRDWRYPEKFSGVRDAIRGLAPHGLYAFCAGVSQIVLKVEVASAGLLSLVVEEDVNAAVVRLRCSLVVAQSDCRSRRDAA